MPVLAAWVLHYFGSWHWVFGNFAALILSCAFFGALMKPIYLSEELENSRPGSCLNSIPVSRQVPLNP